MLPLCAKFLTLPLIEVFPVLLTLQLIVVFAVLPPCVESLVLTQHLALQALLLSAAFLVRQACAEFLVFGMLPAYEEFLMLPPCEGSLVPPACQVHLQEEATSRKFACG